MGGKGNSEERGGEAARIGLEGGGKWAGNGLKMEGKGQEREEYKDTQKKPLQKEAARQERQVHRRSVLCQF